MFGLNRYSLEALESNTKVPMLGFGLGSGLGLGLGLDVILAVSLLKTATQTEKLRGPWPKLEISEYPYHNTGLIISRSGVRRHQAYSRPDTLLVAIGS